MQIDSMQDLLALEKRLKTLWQPRNTLIEEMRKLRFMENDPDVPKAVEPEKVITPTAYQFVRQATGLLTADPIGISVAPASEGDAAVEQASRMEVFLLALLAKLDKQANDDVVERFIECLIADGHGCMRVLWAPQLWQGMPKKSRKQTSAEYNKAIDEWKRGRQIPISLAWVDPLNVLPLWSERGLEAVLEVDQRDVASLEPDKFNLIAKNKETGKHDPEAWEWARVKGAEKPLTFRQLWTREQYIYAVEDRIVHVEDHELGSVPYIYAMGDTISTKDPGKMGLSMLYPLKYLAPYFDRLLSQKGTGIKQECWPTYIHEQIPAPIPQGQEGSEVEAANQLDLSAGKVITIWQGEKFFPLGWTGPRTDIDKQIGMIKNLIDISTMPQVMFGDAGGVDTGYAINQLQTAARVQFKPTIAHAKRAIEELLCIILDIIEYKAKQKLYVYIKPSKDKGKSKGKKKLTGWQGLGPEDINGWREIEVSVNRVMPTDKYANSSMIINEVRARLRDRLSAMEALGDEQPDATERRIAIEDWKQTPEVRAFMTQYALKRAGIRLEQPQTTPGQLAAMLPQLPPALQQVVMAMLMQAGQPGATGMLTPPGPNVPGMPDAAVMAAPGVQAAPGPPTPGPLAAWGHVGPVTHPSGIATGQAPGARRGEG